VYEVADLGSLGSLQGLARTNAGLTSEAIRLSLAGQHPHATDVDPIKFEACANREVEGTFTLIAAGLWGESKAGVLHAMDGAGSTWVIAVTDPKCEVVFLMAQEVDVVSQP
jgi:hypothetical protein